MNPDIKTDNILDPENVYLQVKEFLCGTSIREALLEIRDGEPVVQIMHALPDATAIEIFRELALEEAWQEEFWIFTNRHEAELVSREKFELAHGPERMSRNACLRKPSTEMKTFRALLAAIVSQEVSTAFSDISGETVSFKTADMARYEHQHYLSRHQDLFDDRRFALIWFFAPDWQDGCGGELIVEAETGSAKVVRPHFGSVAVLAIKEGCYHQVAAVASQVWRRFSVAVHFHAAG
ncbi:MULTISPECIES: 2OG-Fe(II) oxygenase family protein [Acetobacteraceae]|uniref:2OG-Fe(II) oxygenase n=2 Tax=Acetobacteraceae TaxID=433 RepID=A0A850P6J8_9PROT|nr:MULTISPECIES: 2OG-Fe(II) oxygenase family protein [Acetobacteraceae]MCG0996257.1 2OG-Fe(II) oxygenase [Acetobacter indonesiensis]NVN37432.1 2OG-Fe(II) oxygenase [Komagataeibacter swingsii]